MPFQAVASGILVEIWSSSWMEKPRGELGRSYCFLMKFNQLSGLRANPMKTGICTVGWYDDSLAEIIEKSGSKQGILPLK